MQKLLTQQTLLWRVLFGNTNYSLDFELNDNNFLSNLFGIDDKNIQIIEKNNNVKIKIEEIK